MLLFVRPKSSRVQPYSQFLSHFHKIWRWVFHQVFKTLSPPPCLLAYYWASFSTQIILHCTSIEAGDFSLWWSLEVFREGFSNCSILSCCFASHFDDCRLAWVFSLRNSIRFLMVGWPEELLPLSGFIFSNFYMLPELIDNDLEPIKQIFSQFFPVTFCRGYYCQLHRNRIFKA